MESILDTLLGVFAALVLGYVIGHRQGKARGVKLGEAYAPIEIRRQSLMTGQCQICGRVSDRTEGAKGTGQTGKRGVPLGQVMEFAKMHGLGNDYIYVDLFQHHYDFDWPALSRVASDRHFGIGADGIILIMPSQHADARMRMFNADGSEGEMCGNGIRCVAKYLYDQGIVSKPTVTIETLAGDLELRTHVGPSGTVDSVTVDMGEPLLCREDIPMTGAGQGQAVVEETIEVGQQRFSVTAVSMGNPHAVVFVDSLEGYPVELQGRLLETSHWFPQRVNVEFVVPISSREISMRVWERGSGETLACGTGACASVVASHLAGRTGRDVTVHLLGGDLSIQWRDDNHVYMTGPASFVYFGQVDVSLLMKDKELSM